MCRLTILPFTRLLWCSFATATIIASVGTTASYYDVNARFQKSSSLSSIITTVAGSKRYLKGSVEDGVAATSKRISTPWGLSFDKGGNLYITAYSDHKIYKVTASSGIITTAAGTGFMGGYGGDGGKATSARLHGPKGVTLDTAGDIFIADTLNSRIRKVTMSTGLITTVAGDGKEGYSGDNVSATSTSLFFPTDVAVDPSGNIFIADSGNSRVRKVLAATGMMTTIAGKGDWTFESRGIRASGSATEYYLYSPTGVALDTSGNVYVVDSSRHSIFKITVSSGNISTVAGTPVTSGYNGDDILATTATLAAPWMVAFDASGNLYISDYGNLRIRKVTANTGMISTVAGTGAAISVIGSADAQSYGEGGLATAASIQYPAGVAIDVAGDLYFVDTGFFVVRKVTFNGATPSASLTSAPSVKGAPSAPVTSTPTQIIATAPTVRPSTFISMAPTLDASPSSSSLSPSSSSISLSPSSSPTVRPSTSISIAPTLGTSSPSSFSSPISSSPSLSSAVRSNTSISMTPTPGASPPSSSSSPSSSLSAKASVAPSSTATQISSATHFAQTIHLTIISLSPLLLLQLCRDA